MQCINCNREIPDNSLFCNWCGKKQIKEKAAKSEIRVPQPRILPSGKAFIQLRIGGQSISITEDTPALCKAKAQAIKAGFIDKKNSPSDITLREACNKYIDSKRGRLTPSTIDSYERTVKNCFQGIMDLKIRGITDNVLDRAVENECTRQGRHTKQISPKTVVNAYNFIIPILRQYNPDLGKNVSLPELRRKIPIIVPADKILPLIIGTDIELPCLLAMWLSLSMSEILGLTKSKSIAFGKLTIIETVTYIKGKPVRREGGKEETRTRVLDIPPYIQGLIDKVETDVLVTLSSHALSTRFTRLLKRNGLPAMSFHKLRHLSASIPASLGVPDVDIQERGGWKTDYTMKKVYTHSFTESRKKSDEIINNYFDEKIQNANRNANENSNP